MLTERAAQRSGVLGILVVWGCAGAGQSHDGPAPASAGSPQPYGAAVESITKRIAASLGPRGGTNLAILPLDATGDVARSVGEMVINQLAADLSNVEGITVVERQKLKQIIAEIAVQQSLGSSYQTFEMGRMAGADVLLSCRTSRVGDHVIVTARLMEVESATALSGLTMTIIYDDALRATLADRKPAWVDTGSDPDFGDADYVTGVGLAAIRDDDLQEALRAADSAARAELASAVEVSVTSEFESRQRATIKDGRGHSTESIRALSRAEVQMQLEGVEVRRRWIDKDAGVVHAMAVWHRARAEALLNAKRDEAIQTARAALAEGDRRLATTPAVALRQYLVARGTLETAQQSAVLLRAVTRKPADVPDVSGVRAKLDEIVGRVQLKVHAGDGQRVAHHAAAARSVSVRATMDGKAAAGVVVQFVLAGGTVDDHVTTDADGIAAARISDAGPLPSGKGILSAHLDWGRTAGLGEFAPQWAGQLPRIGVSFELIAASVATTRVLVKIVERIEDGPDIDTGGVQAAVTNSFVAQGFGVRDGAALTARVPVQQLLTLDPQTFKNEAQDLADVAVVGEAVAAYSSTLHGDVVTHRARLDLRAVDLSSGRVLAVLSLEKKGRPAAGAEKAGRAALAALAKGLDQGFAAQVKAKLGF